MADRKADYEQARQERTALVMSWVKQNRRPEQMIFQYECTKIILNECSRIRVSTENPSAFELEFFAGSDVAQCILAAWHVVTMSGMDVEAKLNGIFIRMVNTRT